jgi:hypothetical protein
MYHIELYIVYMDNILLLRLASAVTNQLNEVFGIGKRFFSHTYFIFRFLMRVVGLVGNHIHRSVYSPLAGDESLYLQEQFSHFLLYCIYMFESGNILHHVCLISVCFIQNLQCFI